MVKKTDKSLPLKTIEEYVDALNIVCLKCGKNFKKTEISSYSLKLKCGCGNEISTAYNF